MTRRLARFSAIGLPLLLTLLLGHAAATAQIAGCSLPVPVNLEPQDGALRASLTPTLKVGLSQGVFGPCSLNIVRWQVFYAPSSGSFPLIDEFRSGASPERFQFTVPAGKLRPGTDYAWRVVLTFIKDDNSVTTQALSTLTTFTTTYVVDGACAALPQPTLVSPRNDVAGVSLTPELEIRAFLIGVDAPCRWETTEWQISREPGFHTLELSETRLETLSIEPGLLRVPAGVLQPETVYYWRARLIQGSGFFARVESPWNAARFRTGAGSGARPQAPTPACSALPLPVHIAPANGATVSPTPTLEMFLPGLPDGCEHDETAWQVFDAAGNYVYQTGFTALAHTSLTVPAGTLGAGATYGWRVKVVARGAGPNGSDVFSDWTDLTYFTTQS